MQAIWNNAILAESDKAIVIEGNHYFPAESIKREYFLPSDHQTTCPWKGEASYYTIEVNGARNDNAAWFYPEPKAAASEIKDHVAFSKGVEIA